MNLALMLHHGVRPNAPNEVTGHSHLELVATTASERQSLKVLADQLQAFGAIPFMYKEMESIDSTRQGAVMRIALSERDATASHPPAGDPQRQIPNPTP